MKLGRLFNSKHFVKLVSFVLSLILLFYTIPSTIFAKESYAIGEDDDSDEKTSLVEDTESKNNAYNFKGVAYEVAELREESAKHFHLEDGSYVAAQYGYPVHYVDDAGSFQDIDNSLAEASGGVYANPNARIKFAKKINGSATLFALHDGNTKLTFDLVGANKGTLGFVSNNSDADCETELQKMMNLEKLSSSILYEEILDGVDIEYVAQSLNVKENIIVKEKKDSYSYTFEMKLNGLSAELLSSGDISIKDDTGAVKYTIPAPVVFDADGVYAPSDAANYTLSADNKKYTLTVTVDAEWMNAEERAFPVTVDPAVVSSGVAITDTIINSNTPNTTYYDQARV